jgi:hypothetical protein
MGRRQAWARRVTYWLEPKNWLIVTVLAVGWHADGRAGLDGGLVAALFTAVLPALFISYGVRRGRWSQVVAGAVLGAGAAALAYAALVLWAGIGSASSR